MATWIFNGHLKCRIFDPQTILSSVLMTSLFPRLFRPEIQKASLILPSSSPFIGKSPASSGGFIRNSESSYFSPPHFCFLVQTRVPSHPTTPGTSSRVSLPPSLLPHSLSTQQLSECPSPTGSHVTLFPSSQPSSGFPLHIEENPNFIMALVQ